MTSARRAASSAAAKRGRTRAWRARRAATAQVRASDLSAVHASPRAAAAYRQNPASIAP